MYIKNFKIILFVYICIKFICIYIYILVFKIIVNILVWLFYKKNNYDTFTEIQLKYKMYTDIFIHNILI